MSFMRTAGGSFSMSMPGRLGRVTPLEETCTQRGGAAGDTYPAWGQRVREGC